MESIKKAFATFATTILCAGIFVGGTAPAAQAEECKGTSGRSQELVDFDGKMRWYDVQLNSCEAKEFEAAVNATGGASLALSAVATKYPILGPSALAISTWSFGNAQALRSCMEPGTGITFKEINGTVGNCKAQ